MVKKHTHTTQNGISETSVTSITIAVIFALLLLNLSPQLPAIVDVGGAATATGSDAYTERNLIQELRGTCFDTDRGLNQLVKGKVTVNGNSGEDKCNSDTSLTEFYCEKDRLKFEIINCPEFCREGKCVNKPTVQEYFKISQRNDGLEIKEALGDVVEAITERELRALTGGKISTKSGNTEYNQYLRFKAPGMDSGSVVYEEDESGQTDDFLKFESGEDIFEYELEFENGLESEISSNGELKDLESKKLNFFGRKQEIVEASISGSNAKIVFMSGEIQDTLKEGETGNYQFNGIDYKIEVLIIEDRNPSRVKLRINDESTSPLEDGETHITDTGLVIGVGDILLSEAGEGGDIVRLYIGAQKIKFQDKFTDDDFESNVDINGELIDGASIKIRGSRAGGEFDFLSLKYRLAAEASGSADIYVPKNRGIKQYLMEPEGMPGGLDIVYGGLSGKGGSVSSTMLELRPSGDEEYNLIFVNRNGNTYSIPYAANVGGSFKLGDAKYDLIKNEANSDTDYNIDLKDLFVVMTKEDINGYSAVLRYQSIDVSNKVIHFDDFAVGGKAATFSGTPGIDATGFLIAGGKSFKFTVGPAPGYKLALDQDGSGSIDGGEAKIIIFGGGILDLGQTLTLKTPARSTQKNVDEDLTFNILVVGNELDLEIPTQSSLPMISVNGERQGMSDVGVFVRQVKRSGGADKLEISYGRGGQRFADVAIVITAPEKPISKTMKGLTGFAVFYDIY